VPRVPREERLPYRSHAGRVGGGGARHGARVVWLLLLSGCNSPKRPWDQPTGGPPPYVSATPPPTNEPATPVASGARLESGGIFVECYAGLRATGDPTKDVTRLGYVCGPVEGMHRTLDAPLEGAIAAGAAELELPLSLTKGACYRVFVAADAESLELDVSIVSSRGIPIATAISARGLAIIEPDRPFCSLGADEASVRVGAKAGAGRFAVDVWSL
jgi:hypothetical protein